MGWNSFITLGSARTTSRRCETALEGDKQAIDRIAGVAGK